jgi:hypothetical protein
MMYANKCLEEAIKVRMIQMEGNEEDITENEKEEYKKLIKSLISEQIKYEKRTNGVTLDEETAEMMVRQNIDKEAAKRTLEGERESMYPNGEDE